MPKRCAEPIVRHSYVPDPNPEKVQAALERWRQALARKMLECRGPEAVSAGQGNQEGDV